MISENILYTDGHDVTVTDSFFQVRKTLYNLKGITKHGLLIIRPDRLPVFCLLIVGAMMVTLGLLHSIPSSSVPDIELLSGEVSANTISLVLGIALLLSGVVTMAVMKDRYAVHIATAEGEKNVVVSKRKEYIAQIVDALNKAFLNLVAPTGRVPQDRRRMESRRA